MYHFRFSTEAVAGLSGEILFLHNNKRSATSAFEKHERGGAVLSLPRILGTESVELICTKDGEEQSAFTALGTWINTTEVREEYKLKFPKLDCGLYFFRIRTVSPFGELYAYPSSGIIRFSPTDNCPLFQMSVSDFKYNVPSDLYGGVIYHIFVDRFNRGGKVEVSEGARLIEDFGDVIPEYPEYRGAPLKNNTFYGGTLWGIIEKLDYISSLGTKAIYLSPIFKSVSNHKYDTADYMSVDEMFGGDEALVELIKQAKSRGIGIILDGVFNHTGADSIYFNRYSRFSSLGAYQSKMSPYYDWFEFESYPDKYTSWWGIEILPRINPDIPSCRDYFVGKDGVVDKYSNLGIMGLRLDVVDELSDGFVKDIKERLNSNNPHSVLFGEVWEDASNKIAYGRRRSYYRGDELDGVMNYPLRKGIINYILYKDTHELSYALCDIINNAPTRIANLQMNLLGTHDTDRILTVLGGESSEGKSNSYLACKRLSLEQREEAKVKLKAAYTVLATLPGIPTIFYGDEAGLEGYHDPFNRMPYPWGKEDVELIQHYLALGKVRVENPLYKVGEFKLVYLSKTLLIFMRRDDNCCAFTIFNNSEKPINVRLNARCKVLVGTYPELVAGTACVIKINKSNKSKLLFEIEE